MDNKLYETITAENWCKFAIDDGRGRLCLIGHAGRIYGWDTPAYYATMNAVQRAILVLYPERVDRLHIRSSFNNHPDTTIDDVIRVHKVAGV